MLGSKVDDRLERFDWRVAILIENLANNLDKLSLEKVEVQNVLLVEDLNANSISILPKGFVWSHDYVHCMFGSY